jgi:hypothetical protein
LTQALETDANLQSAARSSGVSKGDFDTARKSRSS